MSTVVYPFPVLQHDTLDYDNPKGYTANMLRSGNKVTIEHELQGDTMVAELIKKGEATFYGTVSVRGTIFRCTEPVTKEDILETDTGGIKAKQHIQIPDYQWKVDVFASSGVCLMQERDVPVDQANGVSKFLRPPDAADLHFPQHSRVAFSGWKRFFSMNALFHIHSDKEIEEGAFKVNISRADHFRITVTMHPRLFDEVEANRDESMARAHVLCTALAIALRELHQTYEKVSNAQDSDSEDKGFLELAEGLGSYLEANSIPTWASDDFDAAFSASLLYKAKLANHED